MLEKYFHFIKSSTVWSLIYKGSTGSRKGGFTGSSQTVEASLSAGSAGKHINMLT